MRILNILLFTLASLGSSHKQLLAKQQSWPSMSSDSFYEQDEKRVYKRNRVKEPNRLGLLLNVQHLGPSIGGSYDYFFNRDFQLSTNIAFGNASFSGLVTESIDEVLNAQSIRLSLSPRYFIWKNLFVGGGLHLSRIQGDFGFEGEGVDTPDKSVTVNYTSSALYTDLLVGNEWRFNSFFISVDWLNFSFLKLTQTTADESESLDIITKLQTGSESAKDRIDEELKAQLTLGYLAIRFGYFF